MVVVAIIGILSSVAIPNLKKYQAKAKSTEAKLALSSAYATEITFFSEYDSFAHCFPIMGFDLSPNKSTRYYAVGAGADHGANEIARANGADSCRDGNSEDGFSYFSAGRAAGGHTPADASNGSLSSTILQLGAAGYVGSDSASPDIWGMDEKKNLTYQVIGY